VKLRRLRMTAADIPETLEMPLSTVSGILTRLGLGRLGRIGLERPVRYGRSRACELVHIDVKKLGRIRGIGHRVSGSRASQNSTRRNGRRTGVAGWEYVHVAVDDYSRLAYAEVLSDETAVDGWLWHYNHRRRHSALGHQHRPAEPTCSSPTPRAGAEKSNEKRKLLLADNA
jgi:hypothetical protein